MSQEVLVWLLGGVITVLWWLLRDRDAKQQKAIDLLFQKHDADAAALEALKLQIASQHYLKSELDAKFDRLDGTIRDGFRGFGEQIEKLSGLLIDHITKES